LTLARGAAIVCAVRTSSPFRTMRHFATAFLSLCALAAAQPTPSSICQADFNNNVYAPLTSMGGPNLLLGIRTLAPAAYVATRIEVFTGNASGQNSIAIWADDAANNQPLAPVGQGTWMMARTRGWQGANLAQPVTLAAGQTFWVVWGAINGSQASIQALSGPGAQVYRGSFDGGATWNGPWQQDQWKFRIYCGSPGHYEVFGAGCAGTTRSTPVLGFDGIPNLGGSMGILLENAVPNDFALLIVGDSTTNSNGTPLPFDLGPLGAPGCLIQASLGATMFTPTDPAGGAVSTLSFPPNVSLFGFQFYDQWFVHDGAANALGFKVSNGGAGTIGM
jgi:hypothetical protein